jgi:2-polyprenyl-3-methyl-5-hydroxy-6-metoxy-1,4-benzoquinol methylase
LSDFVTDNRRHWDELVGHHLRSDFYDVEAFRRGRTSLLPLERTEVGPVVGRSLVHLQCHFGLDTLSWARDGASVTGIDFSPEAIRTAEQLSRETGLAGRFVECDVLEAADCLKQTYDVVFTSWGVLTWVSDIERWARSVARLVAPDGFFYIAEVHPTALLFEPQGDGLPRLTYGYFARPEPLTLDLPGTYADFTAAVKHTRRHEWIYELGQVVNALITAGLRIEFLREHAFTCYQQFPSMTLGDDRLWRLPADWPQLPLSFSLKASHA